GPRRLAGEAGRALRPGRPVCSPRRLGCAGHARSGVVSRRQDARARRGAEPRLGRVAAEGAAPLVQRASPPALRRRHRADPYRGRGGGTALRYGGYQVEEANSGREALQVAAQRGPDLIVLGWMLPDIDGLEVGRRLRERGFKSAVLFLTAKDATENKVEALRAGGDD